MRPARSSTVSLATAEISPVDHLGRRDAGDGRVLRSPCKGRDRRRRKARRLAHGDQYAEHRVEAVLGVDVLGGAQPCKDEQLAQMRIYPLATILRRRAGISFSTQSRPVGGDATPGQKKARLVSQHIFRSRAPLSGRLHPPPAARRSHFRLLLPQGTLIEGAHQRRRAASSSTPRHRRGGRYATCHALPLDRQADTRLCP